MLQINTKKELQDMAKIIGLRISSSLRKEEYAKVFAEAVLCSPKQWLCRLTHYELLLLQKIVRAGSGNYVEEPDSLYVNSLRFFSFLVVDPREDGKIRYMMCDELRESIAPHIDSILEDQKNTVFHQVEQVAIGLSNLYGLLSYVNLIDKITDLLTLKREEVFQHLYSSIFVSRFTFDLVNLYNHEIYLSSAHLSEIDDLLDKIESRPDIVKLKDFSKDEVLLAAKSPLACISNEKSKEVRSFLMNRLGMTEETAEFHLLRLWIEIQSNDNYMSIIITLIDGKLSSMDELQQAISLFIDYINLLPRWNFKGYSSKDMMELSREKGLLKSPPRLKAGLNMQASGMKITEEMQKKFDQIFYDTINNEKVGRNDPCPCGSGKKYKKCCGNELTK